MILRKHIISAFPAILLALAAACPQAAAAQAGPAMAAPGAPSVRVQTGKAQPNQVPGQAVVNTPKPEDEVYTYQSAGRRDPFLPLIYTAKQAQEKQKSQLRIPLEQYEVSKMIIEAIVTGPGIPSYALVRLPNGKHYTLVKGSVAGVNKGRVVEITPDDVVVRETVTDLTGKKSTHETILKLRKEEE